MAIQHSPEFILECSFPMMLFLIFDVGMNGFLHGKAYLKMPRISFARRNRENPHPVHASNGSTRS